MDSRRNRCLGNAVTVNVIKAIGEKFIKDMEENMNEKTMKKVEIL